MSVAEIMAPSIAVSLRHQLPTNVFLVECMLEKLCSVYTQTPEQQRELYESKLCTIITLFFIPDINCDFFLRAQKCLCQPAPFAQV